MTYEKEYRKALIKCGYRYRDMLDNDKWDYVELSVFVDDFIESSEKGAPVPKMCRWLGYIQGVLIENGLTSIEAERDWTRPLFEPLDNHGDTNV